MKQLWQKSRFAIVIGFTLLGGVIGGRLTISKEPLVKPSAKLEINGNTIMATEGDSFRVDSNQVIKLNPLP